eukprot:275429_1
MCYCFMSCCFLNSASTWFFLFFLIINFKTQTVLMRTMTHSENKDGDDEDSIFKSPPRISPNQPITNCNPFGYNTFDNSDILSINYGNAIDIVTHDKSNKSIRKTCTTAKDIQHDPYYGEEEDYNTDHRVYTTIGNVYRSFCFSSFGIKFTIFLNVMMVLINTFLIIYEVILMLKSHSFTSYYNLELPLFYTVFDVVLTVILLVEITLHITAIYQCHVCNYFKYNSDHKIDILVFLLSLFLCILYALDAFNMSDMDSIGLLMLRVVRDFMRFVRCVIFAKFLYDSYVQLRSPTKQMSVSSPGWQHLKIDKQSPFVCL